MEGIKGNTTDTVILGDAYKIVKQIEDDSIDLIVIDPPYQLDKGTSSNNGRISKALSKLSNELYSADLSIGIDLEILNEFIRIMKRPNIYIWCNKKQILSYLNFFVGQHKCSFEILTWIKSNPVPTCGRNYMNDKECCLYFRKGVALHTTYQSGKTYWITPTNVKDKKAYGHPTIKPLDIIKTIISNSSLPGEVVLDCFLGSGTTAVASKELDRRYIGIEYNREYYDIAMKRIQDTM